MPASPLPQLIFIPSDGVAGNPKKGSTRGVKGVPGR